MSSESDITRQTLHSWIGGAGAQSPDESAVLMVRSPWTGDDVHAIACAGPEGVGKAVADAARAFAANRGTPVALRAEWLTRAAAKIEGAAEDIIQSAIAAVGKPRRAARFEVQRSAQLVRQCAWHLGELGGQVLPLDASKAGAGLFGFTRRVPYGVVGAVTPFNAPANLLLQKVGPALAVGNAVVVKPAPEGLQIALIIAECFAQASLPAGLFNVVAGGREEAVALAAHPDTALLSVTGGTAAGRALAAAAGAKKVVAELGGNSANIVCRDANLQDAVDCIVPSAYEASGQQCISAQRIIVERSVLERFVDLFAAASQRLQAGDPDNEKTDLGPVVNETAADRIMALVAEAEMAGARIVLPPRRQGCLVHPTIILAPPESARAVREEIFGPVAVIMPADDLDDAIRIANDTEYGLQASCFTSSLQTAMRAIDDLEVGSVWVNQGSRFRLDQYPFGGVRSSGYGREGIHYAMEEFTQWKFGGIRLVNP